MNASKVGSLVEAIVRAVEERGVRAAPAMEAIELGRAYPEAVADLAVAVVRRFPESGTFLEADLGYLPDRLWDRLVRFALDTPGQTGKNQASDSVIAYASLRALPSLHPHLDRIFRLRPNAGTYYENWPSRESGTVDANARLQMIEDPAASSPLRLCSRGVRA
jgi:hypothetical protein